MDDEFEENYASLATTTCEWRAFELCDPEVMATRVFDRLRRDRKPADLRRLYIAVDIVVNKTYQEASGRKSIRDGVFGMQFRGTPKVKLENPSVHEALRRLSDKDGALLRQAYWDELTMDEMAVVNGGGAGEQAVKVTIALQRFAARLPAELVSDPVTALQSIHPGTHRRE